MSKFDDIVSTFGGIIKEYAPTNPQQLDLSVLDKATGDQIQQGLSELMQNNPEQANQILQGLVNSKSINPNASVATQPETQQAGTTPQTAPTSTGAVQSNPATNSEEQRAVSQPTP